MVFAPAGLAIFVFASVSTALPVDSIDYNRVHSGPYHGFFPHFRRESLCEASLYCANLTVADAKKIPGWSEFEKYAENDTGTRHLTIRTNDPDEPNYPAKFYIPNTPIVMKKTGLPTCVTSKQIIGGKTSGTTGSASLSISEGYTYSIGETVMVTSYVGLSDTMNIILDFPDLLSGGPMPSVSVSISDTESKSITKTVNAQDTSTVTMDTPDKETCSLQQSVKSCTYQTTGQVQFISEGTIWFDYDSKVKNKAQPKGDKHYKWNFNLADKLNVTQRSTYMTLSGSIAILTKGSYKDGCVNGTINA